MLNTTKKIKKQIDKLEKVDIEEVEKIEKALKLYSRYYLYTPQISVHQAKEIEKIKEEMDKLFKGE